MPDFVGIRQSPTRFIRLFADPAVRFIYFILWDRMLIIVALNIRLKISVKLEKTHSAPFYR